MRTYLERYLERNNEYGYLVEKGSPAYLKALEVSGIGGNENHLSYKYVLLEIRLVRGKYPHYVIHLQGGKNGSGRWDEYLHTQVRMIQSAERKFGDAWVCMLENDVVDDVHELIIGVPYGNELELRKDKYENEKEARVYAFETGEGIPLPAYANTPATVRC